MSMLTMTMQQKPERSPAFDLDARDALIFMIHHDELRADTDPTSVFVDILDLIFESWKHPEGTFDRERIGKLDDMIQERAEEEADEREREKYYHMQILFQSAFVAPIKFFLSSQNSPQFNAMLKLTLTPHFFL